MIVCVDEYVFRKGIREHMLVCLATEVLRKGDASFCV